MISLLPKHTLEGISLLILLCFCCALNAQKASTDKPNVLLIMVDDLNDCIEGMGGHPAALTPNMTRLAKSGVSFKRAYTNAPMCGPSRSSLFTGIYPHNSRNFFQAPWFKNKILSGTRTMMEQFKDSHYQVFGTGKILHHNQPYLWTEFENEADYGPSPFNGEERIPHPDVASPFSDIGWVDGSLGPFVDLEGRKDGEGNPLTWTTGNGRDIPYKTMHYKHDDDRDPTPDELNAQWAADKIKALAKDPLKQPFFLAVGFLRPHTPLVAPQKYFDRFPLDKLKLSVQKSNDDQDTHLTVAYQGDVFTLKMGKRMLKAISETYGSKEAGLKKWTQAYLACVAAVDDNVGEVLDALDQTALRKHTIVVLASDHGFHMGEKDYLYKNSLWEESTRIPLMMRVPGLTQAGTEVEHPVSLIDVYPTLLDLCGLETRTNKNAYGHPLDGKSMRPLLRKPKRNTWEGSKAALTVVFSGSASGNDPALQHYAIRTQRYRYILYNNGKEELYDHKKDPYEWENLAGLKKQGQLLKLRDQLREMVAPIRLQGFAQQK